MAFQDYNQIQNERSRLQRQLQNLEQREMQMRQFEQQQYQMTMLNNIPQVSSNRNNSNGYVWVDGENAARAWYVNAGETVLLMDSNAASFYLKSSDDTGKPLPLRIFDYVERDRSADNTKILDNKENNLDDKYVTRKEYDELQNKLSMLLENMHPKEEKKITRQNKGVNSDE